MRGVTSCLQRSSGNYSSVYSGVEATVNLGKPETWILSKAENLQKQNLYAHVLMFPVDVLIMLLKSTLIWSKSLSVYTASSTVVLRCFCANSKTLETSQGGDTRTFIQHNADSFFSYVPCCKPGPFLSKYGDPYTPLNEKILLPYFRATNRK